MPMGPPSSDGICLAKIGLLVLRDCGAPARTSCPSCTRPVCKQHKVKTPQGLRCPECCAKENAAEAAVPVRRARQRQAYYQRYDYRPFYYSYEREHAYFDDYDHRTFDDQVHVAYDPLEDIPAGLQDTDEGRDWLGLDDFGES